MFIGDTIYMYLVSILYDACVSRWPRIFCFNSTSKPDVTDATSTLKTTSVCVSVSIYTTVPAIYL